MPIKFNCAKCNKAFTVDDSSAGKTGRCSDCGNLNKIPMATAQAAGVAGSEKAGPAMFEVMSGVNGSVFGPADQPTLKQWVKEDRISGDCKIKKVGTDKWIAASRLFPSLAARPEVAEVADDSTTGGGNPFDNFKVGQTPSTVAGTRGSASSPVNPYVSSSVSKMPLGPTGTFKPTSGNIGFILNRAFQQYQENFGTMIGTTFLFFASMLFMFLVFYGVIFFLALTLAGGVQPGNPEAIGFGVLVIMAVFYIGFLVAASYLNTGVLGVMLKVGRGEPANAIEMFSDNKRFLPVLGYGLIVGLISLGCLFVFGVLANLLADPAQASPATAGILLVLPSLVISVVFPMLFWPGIFLIVDNRSGVLNAFPLGSSIAIKNLVQFSVVGLVAGLIYMAGAMLFGIGILFSFPLALLIITCAYLNMTSQISE